MGARFTSPQQDTQPDPVVKTDEQARKHREKLMERKPSDLNDTVHLEVVQNEDGHWVVPDERKKKCARMKAQTRKDTKPRKKKNGRKMPRGREQARVKKIKIPSTPMGEPEEAREEPSACKGVKRKRESEDLIRQVIEQADKYDILSAGSEVAIDKNTPPDVIVQQRKRSRVKFHPDRHLDNKEDANKAFQMMEWAAAEVLGTQWTCSHCGSAHETEGQNEAHEEVCSSNPKHAKCCVCNELLCELKKTRELIKLPCCDKEICDGCTMKLLESNSTRFPCPVDTCDCVLNSRHDPFKSFQLQRETEMEVECLCSICCNDEVTHADMKETPCCYVPICRTCEGRLTLCPWCRKRRSGRVN